MVILMLYITTMDATFLHLIVIMMGINLDIVHHIIKQDGGIMVMLILISMDTDIENTVVMLI